MSGLLTLDDVTKRYVDARRARVALDGLSLDVAAGELVAVWGGRGSGRTTLARVAAGLLQPDSGSVRFCGTPLSRVRAEGLLGTGISFVQDTTLGHHRQPLLERLTLPLIARGVARAEAEQRLLPALERVGALDCRDARVGELDAVESIRIGIAQALVLDARLVVVDEPTARVALVERVGVLRLLRSIADDGVAVLMTAGEAIGLAGVDRALTISAGRLHADVSAPRAVVVPLRASRAARATGT